MSLFLLSTLSISAVFGIDYGTDNIKVGMALPGKAVHVALNQQSKRLSPACFAFWNKTNPANSNPHSHWSIADIEQCSWTFLDPARSHGLRFPSNVIKGFMPLLASEHGFTRRESMALTIRHLISTVDDMKWKPETAQLVISVEPFLSHRERYAIKEVIQLVNGTLYGVIDSPTAAALLYALEKSTNYQDNPKNVMFIDIGSKGTWASVFRFDPHNESPIVTQLSIETNSSLGGNTMDHVLADFLYKKFVEKHKIEANTPRVKQRFIEESRRTKELLSLNKVAEIKIDDIVDDYGLNYMLNREEFESLISEYKASLTNLFNAVIQSSGISSSQLDSIELIGGLTRIPYIQNVLKEISGFERLNRTMNSDEAVALGATYFAASQSSAFVVKKIRMSIRANIDVSLFAQNNETVLFKKDALKDSTVSVYLPVSSILNQTLMIATGTPLTPLSHFKIVLPPNSSSEDLINLTFGFNYLTIPSLLNASLNGTFLAFEVTYPEWAMTEDDFNHSTRFITMMDEVSEERKRIQQIQNDFEAYIYKIKEKIEFDNLFKRVVNSTEQHMLLEAADNCSTWYFGDHESPIKESDITGKLNELKDLMKDPEMRAEQLVKRAPAFQQLNRTLQKVYASLTSIWPKEKPWIKEDQLQNLWEQYNTTLEWFNQKYDEQKALNETQNPAIRVSEIEIKKYFLEHYYNSTSRIKKPTPTPTPRPSPTENPSNETTIELNQTESTETQKEEPISQEIPEESQEDAQQDEQPVTKKTEL